MELDLILGNGSAGNIVIQEVGRTASGVIHKVKSIDQEDGIRISPGLSPGSSAFRDHHSYSGSRPDHKR